MSGILRSAGRGHRTPTTTPKREADEVLRGPAIKDDPKLKPAAPALDADVLEAKLKNVKTKLEGVTAAVKTGGLERLGVTAGRRWPKGN